MVAFNRLTTTAFELQEMLSAGKITSGEAVGAYLEQQSIHNNWLRAVIATPPHDRLKERAKLLDDERREGKVRGPLHGIPVLVKDNLATPSIGVGTTGGCLALVGVKPKQDAELIQRSPYVPGGFVEDGSVAGQSSCGGSSSGSAVGVAAGFAPIAIGTETNGSINMPSTRAALYAIKPTIDLVSNDGIIPCSSFLDSAGPMAKCAQDVADLLDALVDKTKTTIPEGGYRTCLIGSFESLKIGTLDPEVWKFSVRVIKPDEGATKQMIKDINDAYAKIESLAKRFVWKVPMITAAQVEEEDKDAPGLYTTLHALHKPDIKNYLQGLEESPVRTLKELVERNRQIPEELPEKYPSQDILEKDIDYKLDNITSEEAKKGFRARARRRIDNVLEDHDINVLIAPSDSPITNFVAAAGYPLATLPLNILDFNGRPFGLTAITKAHGEPELVKLQSAWEKVFTRKLPGSLDKVEEEWVTGKGIYDVKSGSL
ncbi:amidase signature domain-containing protein [Lophiotrema nucula]|uniref:Amidase signature domain-containing protein n=1 Tax=Lophiotrema nucula TaxID=690887 RepID=A0A6A5YT71_9PLEO|nr:amidase signature domain-containing protein [Lophiotrema nucula]